MKISDIRVTIDDELYFQGQPLEFFQSAVTPFELLEQVDNCIEVQVVDSTSFKMCIGQKSGTIIINTTIPMAQLFLAAGMMTPGLDERFKQVISTALLFLPDKIEGSGEITFTFGTMRFTGNSLYLLLSIPIGIDELKTGRVMLNKKMNLDATMADAIVGENHAITESPEASSVVNPSLKDLINNVGKELGFS